MRNKFFKKTRSAIAGGTLTVLLSGPGMAVLVGSASAQPARAQIPVTDLAHIFQSILNVLETLQEWYSYIQQFQEYYSLVQGVYSSFSNWSNLGWVDAFGLVEMPFFDGIDGIDDIRNITAATSMSVDQLKAIYGELAIIQRLTNDPLVQQNNAYRVRAALMSAHWRRKLQLRMAFQRMNQKHQEELKSLQTQAKTLQAAIEVAASQNPIEEGALTALQAKLAVIQTKIANGKTSLEDKVRIMREQEQHDEDSLQSQLGVMRLDSSDLNNAFARGSDFWKAYTGGQ